MNWPSARSSRASAPRSTMKRAPASLPPARNPSARAPRRARNAGVGWKPRSRGVAVLREHDIGGLVGAVGHVGVEHVGQRFQRGAGSRASSSAARWPPAPPSRRAARRPRLPAPLVSAPLRLPCADLAWRSALRRAWISCSARQCGAALGVAAPAARRPRGGRPRRAIAASKAAGSARMARISCMLRSSDRLRLDHARGEDRNLVEQRSAAPRGRTG